MKGSYFGGWVPALWRGTLESHIGEEKKFKSKNWVPRFGEGTKYEEN